MSGVVLSGAFLVAERRLEAEDRKHEERTAERQTRAQYQLALGMADDLSGKILAGLDLSGLTLTSKDLSGTELFGANLTGAELMNADLTGANLFRANLTGAELSRANLTGAIMTEANLTGANLTGAKWDPDSYPPTWPEGFDPPKNAWAPRRAGG